MASFSQSRMTPQFMQEFGDCLKQKGLPPNKNFAELVDMLHQHKMCYKASPLNPKVFLTHSKNRGGLLLSPHNAHKNAASIAAAGADIDALTNAWCIELPMDGPKRNEIIEKTKRLSLDRKACLQPVMEKSALHPLDVATQSDGANMHRLGASHLRKGCRGRALLK